MVFLSFIKALKITNVEEDQRVIYRIWFSLSLTCDVRDQIQLTSLRGRHT